MIRTWLHAEECFDGWYVNLEQPWTRTAVGSDSRDDVLDVTVSSDLSGWQLKDADELDFAVEVGLFTRAEAQAIHASAATAVEDIVNHTWPFEDATWSRLRVNDLLRPTELPDGWDAA